MFQESPKPKIVGIQVRNAENLSIPLKPGSKPKKPSNKWKVTVLGAKKKVSTESVVAVDGNPEWNCELNVKIPRNAEPLVLLITDSDDHEAGQVIIPVMRIQPRSANPQERPTDLLPIQISTLEPTKKVANPTGILYYWIWVHEYRTEDKKSKSKGSLLSLSHSKQKVKPSTDALSYSGSMVSLTASQGDLRDGKNSKSRLLRSVAEISQLSRSDRKSSYKPSFNSRSSFDPTAYMAEDNDGSVLGASSEIAAGDPFIKCPLRRQLPPPIPIDHHLPYRESNHSDHKPISPVSEEPPLITTNTLMQPVRPMNTLKPALIRMNPASCSTAGGVEVIIDGVDLTDELMQHASVIVDGYTLRRQEWFVKTDPDRMSHYEIHINMPERPTGQCWIEVETLNYGRLRCPQQFTYLNEPISQTATAIPPVSSPAHHNSNGQSSETTKTVGSFVRSGSTRSSSLLIRDRRSTRHARPDPSGNSSQQQPLTSSNLSETEALPLNGLREYTGTPSAAPPGIHTFSNENSNGPAPIRPSLSGLVHSQSKTAPEPSRVLYDSSEEGDGSGPEDGFPVHEAASHRSAASGQSKSERGFPDTQVPSMPLPVERGTKIASHPRNLLGAKESLTLDTVGLKSETNLSSENSSLLSLANQIDDTLDDNARLENESLRAMLNEANRYIDAMKTQIVELEKQLSNQNIEVERLSVDLCSLRNQLLKDGITKYLEKPKSSRMY